MISTTRPIVMPRILLPHTEEPLPLIDAIEKILSFGDVRRIRIEGYRAHDALDWALQELQMGAPSEKLASSHFKLLHTEPHEESVQLMVDFFGVNDYDVQFQRWCDDELIEYLLSKHPHHCRQVMELIRKEAGKVVAGVPELWVRIIEGLIASDFSKTIADLKIEILDQSLSENLPSTQQPIPISKISNTLLLRRSAWTELASQLPSFTLQLLDDKQIYNTIMANEMIDGLDKLMKKPPRPGRFSVLHWLKRASSTPTKARDQRYHVLRQVPAADVIELTAKRIATRDEYRAWLITQLANPDFSSCSASLLFSMDSTWKPNERDEAWLLNGGRFRKANWENCDLFGCQLMDADIQGATLSNSKLDFANLNKVNANSTNWTGSQLNSAWLSFGNFGNATFSRCQMKSANLTECNLANASFEHSNLRRSRFCHSTLAQTSFRFAKLSHCEFNSAVIDRCDFSYASLRNARFVLNDLRNSVWRSTNFAGARFSRCNLDYIDLVSCRLYRTEMIHCTLSGTKFEGLDMRRSIFRHCGLGEIAWTNCDLREADLRGSTFHFGSTRCGIVDSPYPSHGTRTGFYTDDKERLYFEEPESVRRGNLQGCDLRGAKLDGVDFYLIDMRGAKLDDDARQQASATGAILD